MDAFPAYHPKKGIAITHYLLIGNCLFVCLASLAFFKNIDPPIVIEIDKLDIFFGWKVRHLAYHHNPCLWYKDIQLHKPCQKQRYILNITPCLDIKLYI